MLTDAEIAARYVKIRPYLDERQRRLWLGVEAQALGSGGVAVIARATGADVKTVRRGTAEIESGAEPGGRVRGPGGGRPGLAETDAGLVPALQALADPATRGDPMSPLRWTTKSAARLAGELTGQGHPVTARTVASLLAGAGYSLQGNARTIEGKQHPDRDAQFRYINETVTAFQDEGSPVISVDAKKKENVGNFRNGGAEWAPAGQPERVSVHDFPDEELGKVTPYGIYDLTANTGWVNVGTDHTAVKAFAAAYGPKFPKAAAKITGMRRNCWRSMTTRPSTGSICAPPTRSNLLLPRSGSGPRSPRDTARKPPPWRWPTSSSSPPSAGGGWSTPRTWTRSSVPVPCSSTASLSSAPATRPRRP